jgi:porin
MTEVGFTPKWKSEKGEMPGRYRLGGWYDPRSKTIFRDTLGGRRRAETSVGDTGFYLGFDQMIWKENSDPKDSQGVGLFARYGFAHPDRNRIAHAWEIGTSIKGLLPQRDHDVTGVAVSQGILSKDYRDDVNRLADRETVYELYYAWQVTPWLIISPDLQFITNPGGNETARDAIVGGARVRIIF